MTEINRNYLENKKELEGWICSLPITGFPSGSKKLDEIGILINPSDMTELITYKINGKQFKYTIPFLSLFNLAVKQLSFLNSKTILEYSTEKNTVDEYFIYLFEERQKILESIDKICTFKKGFTLNHFILYFSYLHEFEEFSTIPRAHHIVTDIDSIEDYSEFRDKKNISGQLDDLIFLPNHNSLLNIISDSLFIVACSGMTIRKCKLCGKYFITENRSDEMYCRFPNESYSNKPCKNAYKRIAQDQRERGNEAIKLNKRIYNRLRNQKGTLVDQYIKERDKRKPADKNDLAAMAKYIDWLQEYDRNTRKR